MVSRLYCHGTDAARNFCAISAISGAGCSKGCSQNRYMQNSLSPLAQLSAPPRPRRLRASPASSGTFQETLQAITSGLSSLECLGTGLENAETPRRESWAKKSAPFGRKTQLFHTNRLLFRMDLKQKSYRPTSRFSVTLRD